jgi:hypothetical protein
MSSILSVAIYRPLAGNVKHWSLWLEEVDTDTSTMYEVVGEPTSFRRNTLHDRRPESTTRFVRLIHVCEFDGAAATADAKQKLEDQEIHNDVAHWSCQDFVLEALEGLHDEELIQDADYYEAKDELDSIYDQ